MPSEQARLEAGRGLPGTGVFLYAVTAQAQGVVRGARFASIAFIPLVPLGMVRLVPRPGDSDSFDASPDGPVPIRVSLLVFAKAAAALVAALAPAAWVFPRIHETGALPGVRLVAATLLPLVAMAAADLSVRRLSTHRRPAFGRRSGASD